MVKNFNAYDYLNEILKIVNGSGKIISQKYYIKLKSFAILKN